MDPSLDSADDNTGEYLGDGYFYDPLGNGTIRFINPQSGHQFEEQGLDFICGVSNGIVIAVRKGYGQEQCGIDLYNGTIIDYNFSDRVCSVGDGFIISSAYGAKNGRAVYHDIHIYDIGGQEIRYISEYDYYPEPYASDGCVCGYIRGADKRNYISRMDIQSGEFKFDLLMQI